MMPKLGYLLRYLKPYWPQILAAMAALGVSSLMVLALPWALRMLIDSVFVNKDMAQLQRVSMGLFVLFTAQSLLVWLQVYLFTFVANRVIADLRIDVYNHLLELPMRFFNDHHLGEIISRVTSDIAVTQTALTNLPANILRQLIIFSGGLLLALWFDWQLVLLIFLLAPLVVLVAKYLGRDLQALATDVQDTSARLTALLEETLAGIREVKAFTQEKDEQARFQQITEIRFAALMRQGKAQARLIAAVSFLGLAGLSLLLWYGGGQVIAGRLTPGDMIAIIIYLGVVVTPLGEFAAQYSSIQAGLGAIRRVYEIMHLSPEPLQNPADPELLPINGQLCFKKVSFHYTDARPILKSINLTIKPGEVIALVGPSGAGKTTLVNLLARFYNVSAGQIELDGRDISQVSLTSLRQQIGLIPQETFLFGRSVRENIAYGCPTATSEQIEQAARAAYAHEFIAALPYGYDTMVGERGNQLSAGQRQRLAIARLLLKNPRILILDEATTALDSKSEQVVNDALTQLMRGRTTFIITHHLASLHGFNQIVVLEDGMIVAQGTFDELLAMDRIFR